MLIYLLSPEIPFYLPKRTKLFWESVAEGRRVPSAVAAESACGAGVHKTRVWSLGQEEPLERKWQPAPVFLPGKFHGQSLVGDHPRGCKELGTTEQHTNAQRRVTRSTAPLVRASGCEDSTVSITTVRPGSVSVCFCSVFSLHIVACGILVPGPGIEPRPWQTTDWQGIPCSTVFLEECEATITKM